MKTCRHCNVEKPLTEFPRSGKRGHGAYCKPCHNAKNKALKERAMADPIRHAALKAKWARNNRERRARDPDAVRERQRQYTAALKRDIIDAYGGKCVCCGEAQIEFLTLDHINGDGHEHRAKVGEGWAAWRDLRRRGYPQEGYQVLCWNCHMATTWGRVCPHRTAITRDAT